MYHNSCSCRCGRVVAIAVVLLVGPSLALNPSLWTLPGGFAIEDYSFAGPVPKARQLAVSGASRPNGPIITYVSSLTFSTDPMSIHALVDLHGSGRADFMTTIVKGLSPMPNGIAWRNGALFIASLDPGKSCTIYRLDNADSFARGRKTAQLSDLKVIVDSLPTDGWHGWKYIKFGPDGKLYVPIGAPCNSCNARTWRKDANSFTWTFNTIYRISPEGSGAPELFASGVRNTVGFAFHPDTGSLYFTDNGRDDMGGANITVTNNSPDCELNYAPLSGLDFGFPACHTGPSGDNVNDRPYLRLPGIGRHLPDPELNPTGATQCSGAGIKFRPAIQAMGPHVAPLGMHFYKWSSRAQGRFPKDYDRSIFIAQRGSWNRERPIGARVMRVVLDPANPSRVLKYEPFLTGGVPGDKGSPEGPNPPVAPGSTYNGRPVDVAQLPDGSLLVSDDFSSKVYRISYQGSSGCYTSTGSCGYGSQAPRLRAAQAPGTKRGCRVSLGAGLGVERFRRCLRMDMTGQRDFVHLAYSLQRAGDKLVMNGALLANDYARLNGDGWMAVGVPPEGRLEMVGTNAIMAKNLRTGPTVAVYNLGCTSSSCLNPPPLDFLEDPAKLRAVLAGDALVATFSIALNERLGAKLGLILALGGVSSDGAPLKHWTTASVRFTLKRADTLARVPANVPLLNSRSSVGPGSSPSPPLSPSPSPSPGGAQCSIGGVEYDGCSVTSHAGFLVTLYFTKAGDTLKGAIKANTQSLSSNGGWASLAYPSSFGGMVGSDALFLLPCPSCPTGAKWEALHLGGRTVSAFSKPTQAVTFSSVSASLLPSGELLGSFSVQWKGLGGANDRMQVLYGGGPLSSDGTKLKHIRQPPLGCISTSGLISGC